LRKYFKLFLYLYVFTYSFIAQAGSYEDFFQAIHRDDADTIAALLQRGFDPNTPDPQGRHGLVIALNEPSQRVIDLFLATPATRVDQRSPQDETPLMLAALHGQLDIVQKLIAREADVNKTGWTPLHYAAMNKHLKVIALLLEHHAYIDAESPNGTTPLMMAAQYGNALTVKLLLEAGADATIRNQQRLSALDFAHKGEREDSAALIEAAVRASAPRGKW
jgi:ankyrin repeat protein